MSRFQTGPLAGDDEAEPLGDEHYPGNDEYETDETTGETTGDSADEEKA